MQNIPLRPELIQPNLGPIILPGMGTYGQRTVLCVGHINGLLGEFNKSEWASSAGKVSELRRVVHVTERLSEELESKTLPRTLTKDSKREVREGALKDLQVRQAIHEKVGFMLLLAKDKGPPGKALARDLKNLKEQNESGMEKDMQILEQTKLTRRDIKENAHTQLHSLIAIAYAFQPAEGKYKGFDLISSLGRYRGTSSKENQTLYKMRAKNYSQTAAKNLVSDSSKAISLIKKGFTQRNLAVPYDIEQRITTLQLNLEKLQPQTAVVGKPLEGIDASERFSSLLDKITGLKPEKLTRSQAQKLVMQIVDPERGKWPETMKSLQELRSLCEEGEKRIAGPSFGKLLEQSDLFVPFRVCEQLNTFISDAYSFRYKHDETFSVENSLGKWMGTFSAENVELSNICERLGNISQQEYENNSIDWVKADAQDAIALIETAFEQKDYELPLNLNKKIGALQENIKKLLAAFLKQI